jgi:hypothetical protein
MIYLTLLRAYFKRSITAAVIKHLSILHRFKWENYQTNTCLPITLYWILTQSKVVGRHSHFEKTGSSGFMADGMRSV